MATYNVTAPDGTKYNVTAPDDATQAQVLAYAQQQHAQASGPWTKYQASHAQAPGPWTKYQAPHASDPQEADTAEQGVRDDLSQRAYAAMSAGDKAQAMKIIGQLQAQHMTLAPMSAEQENAEFQKENAANVAAMPWWQKFAAGAGKSVVDDARGIGQALGIVKPQDLAADRQTDQALMDSTAGKLGDYAGQAAQMYVTGGALGAGAKALGIAGRAVPYVTSALASGALSGAQPVAPGDSRLANAAVGAGLGAAGEALSPALAGVGRRLAPVYSDAKRAALDTARRFNIPLHLTQVANSPFGKVVGSVTKYLPFSGSYAADQAQRQAWNRALASTIGHDASELTPDVMNAARGANGDAYDALFDRNAVRLDDGTINRLAGLQQQARADLTPEQAGVVDRQIDKYLNAAGGNDGAIAGRRYQNIREELLRVERNNQPNAHYVRQVRHAMEDAAEQSMGPQDSETLRALNSQYKNIKTLERGLAQNGGANNTITPASLWRLTQGRFGGTPELQALGRLGQTVLKDPIHDSGTAQRLLAYNLLGHGGNALTGAGVVGGIAGLPHVLPFAAGLAGTGATIGRLMNSNAAARIAPNLLPGTFNMLSRVPSQYLLPLVQTAPRQ